MIYRNLPQAFIDAYRFDLGRLVRDLDRTRRESFMRLVPLLKLQAPLPSSYVAADDTFVAITLRAFHERNEVVIEPYGAGSVIALQAWAEKRDRERFASYTL